jgi:hypothetical protein
MQRASCAEGPSARTVLIFQPAPKYRAGFSIGPPILASSLKEEATDAEAYDQQNGQRHYVLNIPYPLLCRIISSKNNILC